VHLVAASSPPTILVITSPPTTPLPSPLASTSANSPILSLPPELLHNLLLYCDPPTLSSLAQTCTELHAACTEPLLWSTLLSLRYRSRHPPRHRTATPRHPRDTYEQWHRQRRLPASRKWPHFAATPQQVGLPRPMRAPPALVWATVISEADCRVRPDGSVVLRVLVQNLSSSRMIVRPTSTRVVLTSGAVIPPQAPPAASSSSAAHAHEHAHKRAHACGAGGCCTMPVVPPALPGHRRLAHQLEYEHDHPHHLPDKYGTALLPSVDNNNASMRTSPPPGAALRVPPTSIVVDRARPSCASTPPGSDAEILVAPVRLNKDDFVLFNVCVVLPAVVHEVDVLEQLHGIVISASGDRINVLFATFNQDLLWSVYERMPGGWFTRTDLGGASASSSIL
jgi:F-box-like